MIIKLPDYYKTCVFISYKTSNNQDVIDNMPFYVFNNFTTFLNEIIKEENGNSKGNDNNFDSFKKQQNSTMKSFTSNIRSTKLK